MFTSVFFIVFTIVLSPTEHLGLIGPRFETLEACEADMPAAYAMIAERARENGFEKFSLVAHCVKHDVPTSGV